jgi:hypothetical protein
MPINLSLASDVMSNEEQPIIAYYRRNYNRLFAAAERVNLSAEDFINNVVTPHRMGLVKINWTAKANAHFACYVATLIGAVASIPTTGAVIAKLASTSLGCGIGILLRTAIIFIGATYLFAPLVRDISYHAKCDGNTSLRCQTIGALLAGLPTAITMMTLTKQPFGLSFGIMAAAACASSAFIFTLGQAAYYGTLGINKFQLGKALEAQILASEVLQQPNLAKNFI